MFYFSIYSFSRYTDYQNKKYEAKTYNSWDSHVVTHHTTNQPACGLSTAERTGSPVFHTLWSYVLAVPKYGGYTGITDMIYRLYSILLKKNG